jgi:hypothetical protein
MVNVLAALAAVEFSIFPQWSMSARYVPESGSVRVAAHERSHKVATV